MERLSVVGELDEHERGERRSVPLAPDHQLLHGAAAGCGDAEQELSRRGRGNVVYRDEFGLQVLELLLHRLRRIAGNEEFTFVGAGLPADIVLLAGEVFLFVLEELGGQSRLGACRLPGIGGRWPLALG